MTIVYQPAALPPHELGIQYTCVQNSHELVTVTVCLYSRQKVLLLNYMDGCHGTYMHFLWICVTSWIHKERMQCECPIYMQLVPPDGGMSVRVLPAMCPTLHNHISQPVSLGHTPSCLGDVQNTDLINSEHRTPLVFLSTYTRLLPI